MKNQALFSSKDKNKTLKCCLLQFLFGPLRVNLNLCLIYMICHIFFVIIYDIGVQFSVHSRCLQNRQFYIHLEPEN